MGIRVGIDLGTTFSTVAKIDENTGKPIVIKNNFDSPITPSVLCFERDGNVLFGEDAKNMQACGDENAVAFFKRSMGRNAFSLNIFGRNYSATDLSAILLEKLIQEAESQIGETIDAAVITVPAYFTHKEREATIEAGKRAGLEVIAIINEPTAAAFAYGLNERETEQTALIYDLGGGTFDVTIAHINKNEINILGSDGDHELGGKDWDDCIARFLASEFYEKSGIDISDDAEMVTSLLVTAESVKKQLTARDTVNVPIIYKDTKVNIEITEETFESISQFLIGTTKEVIERLLLSINLTWRDIDGVILVGGSTRMRMIHNYIYEMSGKEPLSGVNVDEAVALGAAIRANITDKGQALPSIGGLFKKKTESVVIRGAKAVTDVTAHSLGMIAVSEDGKRYINSRIINKNSKIPASNTKSYNFRTKPKDNELEVYVLQGEFDRPLDNTVINKYVITKIENTTPPKTIIDVTYEYNSNGVIEVSAMQQDRNKKLLIRIEPVPADMSWADGAPKSQAEQGGMPDVEVILAIDLSGSMYGDPTKMAQQAMTDFVNQMDPDYTCIGVMAFADSARCILPPTYDYRSVKASISSLTSVNVGVGNSVEPFTTAQSTFRDGEVRYLIVLTDGCWSNSAAAISAAQRCHKDGIEVMALGFGTADHKFLKQIASIEEFASLTELSNLSGSFSKIAQAIGEGSTSISLR
jgi:molecular chaperone DnaK (HSP70)/uncharacterized protein YegL